MRTYNKVFLIGNCASEPTLTETKKGNNLLSFPVAIERDFAESGPDGDREVDFHRIVIWGKIAEKISSLIKKGTRVFLVGKIINHVYESNGEKKYSTEIHADQVEILTFNAKNPVPAN
jgi:single-strand DNA-binding protein